MRKISEKELIVICKKLIRERPKSSLEFYKMGMAIELLRLTINNEWVNQSIFHMHKNKPIKTQEARDFFKTEETGFQWQARVSILAERIFNLQEIKNMKNIINKIQEGNLTSRFSELEAGTTFFRREIPFEFIEAIGKKGFDFDIRLMTNPQINCEVKHKIEGTFLKSKTLKKTLKKAKSQLPDGEPGLIFVKIPEEWVQDINISKIISQVLHFFFNQKQNKNIIGIIFKWESRHPAHQGLFLWKVRLERNNKSNLINSETEEIFKKIELKGTRWVYFDQIVHKCISN